MTVITIFVSLRKNYLHEIQILREKRFTSAHDIAGYVA